jgi:hypothetical protein
VVGGLIAAHIFRNADGGNGVDRVVNRPKSGQSRTATTSSARTSVAVPRSSREDDTRPAGQHRETLHDSGGSSYLGHYDSVQDYADQLMDDLGYTDELAKLPESLQPYLRFDTEALAYDMEISGDIYVVNNPQGGVWIFRGNT